jgi:hypothetical protein
MNESDPSGLIQEVAALRQLGADKFDPVSFYHLEVLARRTTSHQDPVKRILDDKLAQALVTVRENFARAQVQSQQAVGQVAHEFPDAKVELQRLHDGGDFAAVKQCISRLKSSVNGTPLGELTHRLLRHRRQDVVDPMGSTGIRPELKATQYFRQTWAKLSVNKRVAQALIQAPKDAGPINSHMLVLRSLALMRDISPDYLNRFTSYVDTLLCLDQGGRQKQVADKTTDATSAKKTRSRLVRGQSR